MVKHWVQPKHWPQTLYKTREVMIPEREYSPTIKGNKKLYVYLCGKSMINY